MNNVEQEIIDLIDKWNRAVINRDMKAAEQFRADEYIAVVPSIDEITNVPSSQTITKAEELVLLLSLNLIIESLDTTDIEIHQIDDKATAVFNCKIKGQIDNEDFDGLYNIKIVFVKNRKAGEPYHLKQ